MRSVRIGASVLVLVALLSAGCGGSAGSGAAGAGSGGPVRAFPADNGVVQVPVAPRRVAVLLGGVSNVLQVGVKPVATTLLRGDEEALQWFTPSQRADYDAAVKVGGLPDIDYEALAGARPDLIVSSTPRFAWERLNAERLASIAPTVYIETVSGGWKVGIQRLADVVGAAGAFDEQRAAYERRVAEVRAEHADLLGPTTFAVVNRWASSPEASFTREYAGSFCATYAADAGLKIPGASPTGRIYDEVSLELVGDLVQYGGVLYPLDADGSVKAAFTPVAESAAWKALVERSGGRVLGVRCTGDFGYQDGITYLDSLDQALGTMPKKR